MTRFRAGLRGVLPTPHEGRLRPRAVRPQMGVVNPVHLALQNHPAEFRIYPHSRGLQRKRPPEDVQLRCLGAARMTCKLIALALESQAGIACA